MTKAALVTGAARRIGLSIAERLVMSGYNVVFHTSPRSEKAARAEAERIGHRAYVIVADLADAETCTAVIGQARDAVGRLSLLVNNAALFEEDRGDTFDVARLERHLSINLRAPLILARDFAAQADMEKTASQHASIVNIIDQRVLRPTPLFFSYTLAKSALWTATRTMAQSFADRGVRVNAVGPGPVLPNDTDGVTGFSKEVEGVPMHRAVDPADVAAAVLYLAEARAVTGQMIAVDAGQHLGWRTPDVIE